MSRSILGTVQLLALAALVATGLTAPKTSFAGDVGYECILDTEDGGVTQTDDDDDQGADANGTDTNLACGGSSVAGADGQNTAIGVGSMAGVGAGTETSNTAVGEEAMAGVGDGSSFNTATGENAQAGVGANSDQNSAYGEDSMAGVGAGSSFNSAYGQDAQAGVGANSDQNSAFGEDSSAGVGAGSSFNSAFGQGADAGVGADSDQNSAFGEESSAGIGAGSDRNVASGASAEAGVGDGSDDNIAVGYNSDAGVGAGSSNNVAIGDNAEAGVGDALVENTAVGSGAMANFTRSSAFGADAMATRDNQMVYGTATETHTMPGLPSQASRDAQSGPLGLVTTDAMGNLASDAGETFGRIRANADDIDDNSEGIAMAMSIQDPDLVGDERLGLKLGWGTFSGENAIGVAASGVLVPDIGAGIRLGLAGGAAFGLSRDGIGGRAGLQLTW